MLEAIGEFLKGTIGVLADLGTIAASVLAIWIFIAKRAEIRAFVKAITTFVHQNSLAELRVKLEKLNDLHAADPDSRAEIVGIFHDICGQVDGSPVLRAKLGDISSRIRQATSGRRQITEPQKRSLVSELRESLRHLDVADYAESMREEG